MRRHFNDLSARGSPEDNERIQWLIEFWNGLSVSTDAGETIEEVRDFQVRVMDCLVRIPPDVRRAERLTAEAANLIAGQDDS